MNDIERGDLARDVLQNAVYDEAYKALEQELIQSWQQEKNADARDDLWREQRLLSKVRTRFEVLMQNGSTARQRSLKQVVRDLVRSGTR